ncbi:MAG TPA: phosphatase PAP2 family protein [Acidimicrobiales bacterium]|nr:phosphatase PAP2 family protein [Acidimicrobiales bacterium]
MPDARGGARRRDAGAGGPTISLVGPAGYRAAAFATGAGLLTLSWLALGERDVVPGWEADTFDAINGVPDWVRWPLWAPMQLGTLWMCLVGGAGVYAATRRVRPALATAGAVLLAWAAAKAVKDLVGRGRPADLLGGVEVRQADIHSAGFVSGHTAVAFALATMVAPLFPSGWRWVPFGLATVVGLARIYYGVHLPLDVVGGAGLGLVCGAVGSVAAGTIAVRRR